MRIFISYAREDQAAVEELSADLERARVQVWMDEELIGGEAWWDTVLEQIRSCELYIFALSPNSVRSRACQAQLDYAIALSRPLLPVLIRDVAIQLAHPAIVRTQMVDYRKRSMESLLALMAVVANRPPAPPLPDPLPEAPTTPLSYMNEFRELVDAPDLTYQKQAHLLLDLKGYLDRDEERDIALQLIRGLRQRRDISYSIAREIDQLSEFANEEDAKAAQEPRARQEAAEQARGRIFISYRRRETAIPAGWLYDRLSDLYAVQVFENVGSIELGDDFVDAIRGAVGSCDVLLALIGDRWVTIADEDGRRRLDDPDDHVRLEIEAALTRHVRVIPILVNGATMPRAEELPPSLARLVRNQALELSPDQFDFDLGRLLKVLDRTLTEVRTARDTAAAAPVPARKAPDPSKTEPLAASAMSEHPYLNLDLLIERAEPDYRVRVLASPAGESRPVSFQVPFSDLEVENFLLKIGRPRRNVRRINPPQVTAIKDFGGRLFEAVFSPELHVNLAISQSRADAIDAGLRIRLRFSDCPELSELPWEYLYDREHNRFLCLSDRTPLVRYLEVSDPVRVVPVTPPLRILVVIASPSDLQQLDSEQEWSNVTAALSELTQRGRVEVVRLEKPTLGALQRQLRRGTYHIFHFIGHGDFDPQTQAGMLAMEDDHGRARLVAGEDLGTLLHDHRSLRLAVLNSCEGARGDRGDPFSGTAQSLIQQGIPAVVAMQFEITDDAAITFGHVLYEAIADGYPLDAATTEARIAVYADGNLTEWGTPVLYSRAPDGRIFDIQDRPPPVLPPSSATPPKTNKSGTPGRKPRSRPRRKPRSGMATWPHPVRWRPAAFSSVIGGAESGYPTGWLYERLANHFGREDIVRDIDSIAPGDDFVKVIDHHVVSCDVMLVVIGTRWISITDEDGRRRLDDQADFVRREIEAALQRDIRVIPILVDGATMPRSEQLPPQPGQPQSPSSCCFKPDRFQDDTDRLLRYLDKAVSQEKKKRHSEDQT